MGHIPIYMGNMTHKLIYHTISIVSKNTILKIRYNSGTMGHLLSVPLCYCVVVVVGPNFPGLGSLFFPVPYLVPHIIYSLWFIIDKVIFM